MQLAWTTAFSRNLGLPATIVLKRNRPNDIGGLYHICSFSTSIHAREISAIIPRDFQAEVSHPSLGHRDH